MSVQRGKLVAEEKRKGTRLRTGSSQVFNRREKFENRWKEKQRKHLENGQGPSARGRKEGLEEAIKGGARERNDVEVSTR